MSLILTLAHANTFYQPFAGAEHSTDHISPLSSQPIVELCLQIPVYLHLKNGWDRAIERRAFADALPPRLISRRDKGHIASALSQLVQLNQRFLFEFMLNGELVKNRVLDVNTLEAELRKGDGSLAMGTIFYHYFAIEKWLHALRSAREKSNFRKKVG
jgi:asparagine synthase (glutamine-hydrolysing)